MIKIDHIGCRLLHDAETPLHQIEIFVSVLCVRDFRYAMTTDRWHRSANRSD